MKTIIANSIRRLGGALTLIIAAAHCQAQTWAEGPAACLGPTMPYEAYPVEVMKNVQRNLWIVYHEDPLWDKDAQIKTLNGTALQDGVMGPITWSWMNRFCGDFWLPLGADPMATLPGHLDFIAAFSGKHGRELGVLVSPPFFKWVKLQADSDYIKQQLRDNDEQKLLELVKRYEGVPAKSIEKAATPKPATARNSLYRYVLRADDFAVFAKPPVSAAATPDMGEIYDSPDKLKAALGAGVAKLPPEQQQKAKSQLQSSLAHTEEVYRLTEASLKELDQSGLTALEFVELNKLANTVFTDAEKFKKKVNEALTTAATNLLNSSASSSAAAEVSQQETDNLMIADMERVQIRVFNAAKGYRLRAEDAKKIAGLFTPAGNTSLDPLIIKAITHLENLEYPEGELLHHAALDKLAQALDVCDENQSTSLDLAAPVFTPEERQNLRKIFGQAVGSLSQLGAADKSARVCDDDFWAGLNSDYDARVRPAIEQQYIEEAPAYDASAIKWSGKECGCIPDQIKATAYGIYPYWAVSDKFPYGGASDKPRNFDFSTFSRVGFYGFSFNSMGELTQPGSADPRQGLFDPHFDSNREFIAEARTYGSKIDWIIEKDWQEDSSDKISASYVRQALSGLQINIVNLLATQIRGSDEYWRPLITLGVAQRPTMGDGVTLYFKNYPQEPEYKEIFESFFRQLKANLRKLSDERAKWSTQRQDFFVNLIVTQQDYLNPDSLFNNVNILGMIGTPYDSLSKLTVMEEQAATKTLVLVLINNPYFNSLQTLYSSSTSTYRGYVLPTVMIDYKKFSTGAHSIKQDDKRSFFDERRKVVSYQREAFGGGAYWYMPTWDAAATSDFNNYIANNFALGYPNNVWDSTLCAYRWQLLGIMNLWLLVALAFVGFVFYIYPYRCHPLPAVVLMLINPVVLALLIIPPVLLWCYLQWVDENFPLLSLPSVLLLALLVLSIWAGVDWIKRLRQLKPSRNLAQLQAANARLPKRDLEQADQDTQEDAEPPQ